MARNNSVNKTSKITQFTASGTWTKDVRTQSVSIFGMSSGVGGGGGRRGLTTAAGGGAGGNSGVFIWCERVPSLIFSSSETVTIGGTSAGGTAQTSDSTNGNTASSQNSTSIGYISATAQTSNTTGGNSSTASASSQNGLNFIYINATGAALLNNIAGGSGRNSTGLAGVANQANAAGTPYMFGGTGGGGSGANSTTPQQAGAGGSIIFNNTTIITGSAGGIESGTINGTIGTNVSTPNKGLYYGGSGGGGGGGQSTGGSAGTGGAGGTPGGSGGGGGGSINGTNSGPGGLGQAGDLWVVEFF